MITLHQSLQRCRDKWQEAAKEGDSAKMLLMEKLGKKIKELIDKNASQEQISLT